MKTRQDRAHALKLFLDNIPVYKIAAQLHTSKQKIIEWREKNKWNELREKTFQEQDKKLTENMIKQQKYIAQTAQIQLKDKLDNQERIISQINELHSQIQVLDKRQDKEERLELYSMMNTLVKQLLEIRDLIAIMRHGLEVIRPKETTNNLNITKNDNKIIQVNIPKEVQELIKLENMEKEV